MQPNLVTTPTGQSQQESSYGHSMQFRSHPLLIHQPTPGMPVPKATHTGVTQVCLLRTQTWHHTVNTVNVNTKLHSHN